MSCYRGHLQVTVIDATGLRKIQKLGTQDPYCVLWTEKAPPQKTSTHEDGGSEAVWNQSFKFDVLGEPVLFVEVKNENLLKDSTIGRGSVPLKDVYEKGSWSGALPLNYTSLSGRNFPGNAGTINLQLEFKHETFDLATLSKLGGVGKQSIGALRRLTPGITNEGLYYGSNVAAPGSAARILEATWEARIITKGNWGAQGDFKFDFSAANIQVSHGITDYHEEDYGAPTGKPHAPHG
eukprot:jgi/Mesen1/9158/ME000059S08570